MKTSSHISTKKTAHLPSWAWLHWLAFAVLFTALLLLIFWWYNSHIQQLDQQLKSKTNAFSTQ